MQCRLSMFCPYTGEYKIRDRMIVLVDDGIATGATMIATARGYR